MATDAALFSRRTLLNFFSLFLTAINLPSALVPLSPSGLAHQLAFDLGALPDGTEATVISSGFVASHDSSPANVKRVVQRYSDLTR